MIIMNIKPIYMSPLILLFWGAPSLSSPGPSKSSATYDNCILDNTKSVKDRHTLSAIKRSCFNLHQRPKKVPKVFWNDSIRLSFRDVNRLDTYVVSGTEGWTKISVENGTNYRLTSITLKFSDNDEYKFVDIMNGPFQGYGDIDQIHIPSYTKREGYYVDLRSFKSPPKVTIIKILGVVEQEIY